MKDVSTLYLPMKARIQKWGNSLALRIPKPAAQDAGLTQGMDVDVQATKGRLVVRPRAKKVYTLASLLRGVRRSNIHPLIDFGGPVGRELL